MKIFRVFHSFKCCLIFTCMLLFTYLASAQTANEILTHYFDTISHGDPGRWEKVKTFYAKRMGYFDVQAFQQSAPELGKNPNKVGYTIEYRIFPETMKEEGYDDSLFSNATSQFYYIKDKRIIKMANLPTMEATGDNSFLFDLLPMMVMKRVRTGKTVLYNGLKSVPGIPNPLHKVEIQTNEDIRGFLFNTESYLLEAVTYPQRNTCDIFSEYKDFDGYLMPTKIRSTINGVPYSWITYYTMLFNLPIDPDKFKFKRD